MRILVLWAGSSSANLGVRALAEGMSALAQRAWGPDTQVDFQDYGPGDSSTGFGGRTIIRDVGRRSGPIKTKLRGYDIILDSGAGDSFADIYGIKRLATMNYAHRTASKLELPLILGPQTVGPFRTVVGRALGRDSLRRMRTVLPRDSESLTFAAELGFPSDLLSTDVVFALAVPDSNHARDVIVNVSGLLWHDNAHVDSGRYRTEIIKLVEGLVSSGRKVSLLAHVLENPTVDNDVPAVLAVAEHFNHDLEVIIPSGLAEARSVIGSSRLVIGSRMHACLNALSAGVPAIPWAYSRKFSPLMNDLGWPFGFDLRVDKEPASATLDLIKSNSEETLRVHVAEVLRVADKRIKATAGVMRLASLPGVGSHSRAHLRHASSDD